MRNKCGATTDEAISVPGDEGLISPADWPRTLLHYTYSNSTGAPQLNLEFHLDGHGYIDQDEQAKRDLARYQQVCDQLRQDDADEGLPVAVGGAVTMQLSHSLLADPVHVLDEHEAGVIRRFVADCVAYLTAVVRGTARPPAPSATLSQTVTWTELAAGAWVQLDVALSLMRHPSTIDPGVAEPADRVICPILPQPDGGNTDTTIAFARNFEAIFKNDAWKLRMGQTVPAQTGDGDSAHSQQLWVMRFGADGIAFEIGETASYYAPRPIAQTLVDRSVIITTYPEGDKTPIAFSRIDQNAWFHTALEALDAFLAPPASSAVRALDQRLGYADPMADGYLGKVVAAKQSLADSISANAAPILSTSLDDASTQWAAQSALRQQLLAQLGPAYAAGVTVVFGLDHVTGGSGSLPPRLYGQPHASLVTHAGKQRNALSPASLPLGSTAVDGETYAPRLAFATMIENNTERTYTPLDLRYQITHLEFDRADVPGTDDCPQRRRLSLVTGPIDVPLGNGISNIPLCSRVVPPPSVSSLQTAEKSCSHPTTAEQLALWTYRVAYRCDQAVQDTARVAIEFDAAPAVQSTPGAATSELFDALAQFVSTYPGIAADFALSFPAMRSGNADDAMVQLAHRAVAAFQSHITAIATAHAAHGTAQRLAPTAPAASQRIETAMTLRLDQAADGSALCVVTDLHINGIAATWNEEAGTMSNGATALPVVWVEIAPETYQAEPIKLPVADIAFRYRATDGAYLSFESARAIETRDVVIHGLDAMVHQSAWSSCEVERNRVLTPIADGARIKTRDDFVLRAPATQHEAVMPRIEHAMFSLDGIAPPSAGIRDVLDVFYANLFKGGNGSLTTHVTMNPAYSYSVMAGGPRALLPIAMMLPQETRVIPAPPPAFIESISSVITHWLANTSTSGHEEPRLDFTVTLSTAREAQEPLLTIHDMSRSLAS